MNSLNFKNVLITGVTGLLGSWLAEELLNKNIKISGIALDDSKDDLLTSKNLLHKFPIDYFDISNEETLNSFFDKNTFDIVFHLAAQTQVIEADLNPVETFNSNIKGTWNILENCRIKNIPVVVASSDKAYGISRNLPYKESHELNGVYPYEVSKTITDILVKSYKLSYDLEVTTLRCGNIYGGGDLNWDRLIPGLCKWFINGEQPILRSNGEFKRDWVYVLDVANAYINLANNLIEKPEKVSMAYNFAGTDYKSVMDIYTELSFLINGKFIKPKFQIDSKKEIPDQYLDSSKIFEELGINNKYSINEGLEETVNWYKSYFLKSFNL